VKVDEGWQDYRLRTSKLSDVVRSLAFAGIALLWVFSNGAQAPVGPIHLPGGLHGPAFALLATLVLDLLGQSYSVMGVRWFTRGAEKRRNELQSAAQAEFEFTYPVWFPLPAEVIFALKLVAVLVAYIWLGASLASSWL